MGQLAEGSVVARQVEVGGGGSCPALMFFIAIVLWQVCGATPVCLVRGAGCTVGDIETVNVQPAS